MGVGSILKRFSQCCSRFLLLINGQRTDTGSRESGMQCQPTFWKWSLWDFFFFFWSSNAALAWSHFLISSYQLQWSAWSICLGSISVILTSSGFLLMLDCMPGKTIKQSDIDTVLELNSFFSFFSPQAHQSKSLTFATSQIYMYPVLQSSNKFLSSPVSSSTISGEYSMATVQMKWVSSWVNSGVSFFSTISETIS